TYNITASSSSSAVTYLDFGGIISSAASHSLTAVSISANTTFTIQPSAPGPCSFSMSSGYFSPTNGLSSNGNAASGYLV
ncbi:hypothetical protein, partial [Escherichia coli]|uniref:hypothetical protein n=1 Tax=Escherichia coli TaxID=562 RepID=UPI0028FC50B1